MVVAIAVVELHIPAARGLKEKRKVIKSLIDRLAHRYRISIAETGLHDLHQRSEIGLAMVGADPAHLGGLMERIREIFETSPEAQLVRWEQDLVEDGGRFA